MKNRINRDTKLCISMSARPSNIGTRFHNYLYEALDLNFVYKAFSPTNIEQAVQGLRGLGIRGAAVSMPFKSSVIPLLDVIDPTAEVIGAVNTIVNEAGVLTGYNTDFIAVRDLFATQNLPQSSNIAVLGSGGMAKAVVAALVNLEFKPTVVARNRVAGSSLANQYGCEYLAEYVPADVVVNATPIGMAAGDAAQDLPISINQISDLKLAFDVVAMPVRTPFIQAAQAAGVKCLTGREVMTLQAVEQFQMYTGVRPNSALVSAAEEFAHSLA